MNTNCEMSTSADAAPPVSVREPAALVLNTKEEKNSAFELLQFIKKATSPYQVVDECIIHLESKNFILLHPEESWTLLPGRQYMVSPYPTCLFAFTVPDTDKSCQPIHLAAAHTDSPCLHIKPAADSIQKKYLRLNTEVYGGPILNTWLDRPLSIAGCVAVKSNDIFHPTIRLVDLKKPLLTIPNLAIHMNREVNKGVELSKQKDMLSLLALLEKDLTESEVLLSLLSTELNVEISDILDFDLYVYNAEDGCLTGLNEEFLSAPRIDNLTSCFALVKGISNASRTDGINIIALFDHEEVGSGTSRGANASLLPSILEKITHTLGRTKEDLSNDLLRSFLLSTDVAHGLHPNQTDKYDMANSCLLGQGVTLKLGCNKRYVNDTIAVASIQQLCEKYSIPYKKHVNHSDVAGGGTLGTMLTEWLPMNALDVGVPILAMHSARELMGTRDQLQLERLVSAFFQE